MTIIDVSDARTELSQLLDRVLTGEEVVFTRGGTPVARLASIEPAEATSRRLGILKGQVQVPPDFDAPLPDEVLDAFYGR